MTESNDTPMAALERARTWRTECIAAVERATQAVAAAKLDEAQKLAAVSTAAAAEESALTFDTLDAAQREHNSARSHHAIARRIRERAEHALRKATADLESARKSVITAADHVMAAGQPERIARFKKLLGELLESCSEIAGDVPHEIDRPLNFALLGKHELRAFEFFQHSRDALHEPVAALHDVAPRLSTYERTRLALISGQTITDESEWETALNTPVSELPKVNNFAGLNTAAEPLV